MPMLADLVPAVVGVDTHLDTHTVAVASAAGAVLATETVPADAGGFARIEALLRQHAGGGPLLVAAVEGTRSHGLALARHLQAAGITVVEIERPSRAHTAREGKSDPLDAIRAARAVLGYDPAALPTPRADGLREALRVLLVARQDMTDERTAKVNALRALLRTGDPHEQALSRGALTIARLAQIATLPAALLPADPAEKVMVATLRAEAARLALRIRELDAQIKANLKSLREGVEACGHGWLLDRLGIGPRGAAQILVSWSHPGRCRNEAAFAKLAGAAPIPTGSGRTSGRHRLNRGGDRALNRTLHDIASTRLRYCPATKAYATKRDPENKHRADVLRRLKRYLARDIYRELTRATSTARQSIPAPAPTKTAQAA